MAARFKHDIIKGYTWKEARIRMQQRMCLSLRQAVQKGLIPPLIDSMRHPKPKPRPQEYRKEKDKVRKKNYKSRFDRLKICARLAAWLDSFIIG
eukprot:12367673-Karenia_brevis.AAC.1